MTQKRFLTATEVFQLFGVDADGLDRLVKSGDITALPDLGTFKYRSEDFANLVKQGKLVPRTSGELFQTDDKGELPFLKIKNEDQGLKFGEKVEFLELDEEALEEQARHDRPGVRTPVVPDNWFEDTESSLEIPAGLVSSSHEVTTIMDGKSEDDATDLEVNVKRDVIRGLSDSDSDVRIFADDEISLEGYHSSSGSDSDVRLVGPVSSPGSSRTSGGKKTPGGDSEIRLVKRVIDPPQSDSDVTILTEVIEPSAHFNAPTAQAPSTGTPEKKATTGSGMQLVAPPIPKTAGATGAVAPKVAGKLSDSDVVIVGLPGDAATPNQPARKKGDSDSDVRLSNPTMNVVDLGPVSPLDLLDFPAEKAAVEPLDFGDSDIRLEDAKVFESTQSPHPAAAVATHFDDSHKEQLADWVESDTVRQNQAPPSAAPQHDIIVESDKSDSNEFEIMLEDEDDNEKTMVNLPPGVAQTSESAQRHDLDATQVLPTTDSEIVLVSAKPDSDIQLESGDVDSGIALEKTFIESGMTPELHTSDSDITLEIATSGEHAISGTFDIGSGIVLEEQKPDSGIQLDNSSSGILFGDADESSVSGEVDDSGITLDGSDSDITIDQGDSGITLEDADSGISLSDEDSGISLSGDDSGISLNSDRTQSGTIVDDGGIHFAESLQSTHVSDLDSPHGGLEDSGFDVSLSEDDHTIQIDSSDEDVNISDAAATLAEETPKKKGSKKQLALSEAFQLDEPPEVEDLDISDDLNQAGDDFTSEFSEADEDALDVSDDAFSSNSILSEIDEDDESRKSMVAAVAKKTVTAKEPAWGLFAVLPIMCASLAMAATLMALVGGITTMWTGEEAAGPLAMVISTLAGLM